MPIEIDQHAGLERRKAKQLQAVMEEALKTEHDFEGGKLAVGPLNRSHKRSISSAHLRLPDPISPLVYRCTVDVSLSLEQFLGRLTNMYECHFLMPGLRRLSFSHWIIE